MGAQVIRFGVEMGFVIVLGTSFTNAFAALDAVVHERFPAMRPTVSNFGVIRREAAEDAGVSSFGDGESRVKLGEVVDGVQLVALLAEEGGAGGAASHSSRQLHHTIFPAHAAEHQWHRLTAAVVCHQVHDVLHEEVVGDERDVATWDLGVHAALWTHHNLHGGVLAMCCGTTARLGGCIALTCGCTGSFLRSGSSFALIALLLVRVRGRGFNLGTLLHAGLQTNNAAEMWVQNLIQTQLQFLIERRAQDSPQVVVQ